MPKQVEKKDYSKPPCVTNRKGERVLPPGMTPKGLPEMHPGYKYANAVEKRYLSGKPLKNYIRTKLEEYPGMTFSELLTEFTNDRYYMPKATHLKVKKKDEMSGYYMELRKKKHKFLFN